MKTMYAYTATTQKQYALYNDLNALAKENTMKGRFTAIPVAVADVALDTIRPLLSAVEFVALTVINIIGKIFCYPKCTLKGALSYVEGALTSISILPAKVVLAPLKLLYQVGAGLWDPIKVESCIGPNPKAKQVKD